MVHRVTVVIPCRNERGLIGTCLDSILSSDFPLDRLEVLVVDGMSDDGTRDVVRHYAGRNGAIKLLDNKQGVTPVAVNIGIRRAKGDVIMLLSAHASIPAHYISGLVAWLDRSGADGVGGVMVTRPANGSSKARAIAAALSHPFGVGNSYFRIGVREPRWVDTIPFGCYRREVFDRVGLFDEELVRNQDEELNLRLLKQRGRLLLVPEIASEYYARDSFAKLWRMYYQYGYFKPLVIRKARTVFTLRQLVPALFVGILLLAGLLGLWSDWARMIAGTTLATYAAADVAVSLAVASRDGWATGAMACLTFPILHVSYGIGFLQGLSDFVVLRRGAVAAVSAVPLSR